MANSDIYAGLKKLLDPGSTYREKALADVTPSAIQRRIRQGTAGDTDLRDLGITQVGGGYVDNLKKALMAKALAKLNRLGAL
jgi:hypothetical protein